MTDHGMGQLCHFEYKTEGCKWSSHCRSKNYLVHKKECEKRKQKSDQTSANRISILQINVFCQKVLPCLYTLTSQPSSQFIWFVRSLVELWPRSMTPTQFLEQFTSSPAVLHAAEGRLADEVWSMLRIDIDSHVFFGIACDAGIDRNKSEHI